MKDSDETTKQKPRSRERRIRENVGREVTDVTFAALIAKKWSYKTQAGTVRSGPNKKDHGLLMLLDNKSTPPVHRLFCNICSAPVSEKVGQHIGGHRHHNLHIAALSKKVIATSVENESVASVEDRAETNLQSAAAMSTTTNSTASPPVISYSEPQLTLSTARRIASQMEAMATRRNLRMVFAICDQHGNLKLFHRMDGTSSGSVKVAQAKAYTAASLPFSTKVLAERSEKLPANPYASLEGFLPLGGGVPIFSEDGIHLGGVGVSGATPEIDEEIACFGIQSMNGISCTRGGI